MSVKLEKYYENFIIFLICLLVLYFLSCFHFRYSPNSPSWTEFGKWSMFTHYSHYHKDITASFLENGKWKSISLQEIFPSKWDSGYRYQSPVVWTYRSRLIMLAASTCKRLGISTKVRIYREYWPIIPGQDSLIKENSGNKKLLEWNCGDKVYTPKGSKV